MVYGKQDRKLSNGNTYLFSKGRRLLTILIIVDSLKLTRDEKSGIPVNLKPNLRAPFPIFSASLRIQLFISQLIYFKPYRFKRTYSSVGSFK